MQIRLTPKPLFLFSRFLELHSQDQEAVLPKVRMNTVLLLKKWNTALGNAQAEENRYRKALRNQARIRQELLGFPCYLVTSQEEMYYLARLAAEEEKLTRRIVVPSFLCQKEQAAIMSIADGYGFAVAGEWAMVRWLRKAYKWFRVYFE